MIRANTFVNEQSGVRLDAVLLTQFPTSTRAFVRDAIAASRVLISASPAASRVPIADASARPRPATTKGLKLRGGETITVTELLEESDNLVTPQPEISIISPRNIDRRIDEPSNREIDESTNRRILQCFEDDALLAFDKPSGMPVQPLSCRETGTLMNAVVARYPECRPLGDRPLMAGALHRIDADTSGLVLVARTAEAFERLRAQFTAQTVKKTYLALVEGAVAVGGTLEHDLIHDPTLPFCRMIDARHDRHSPIAGHQRPDPRCRPLHAVTAFRPIAHTTVENEERTLLEVTIYTGVTHQIRAQLALAGMHIINDRLYGAFAVENQRGHCLHALAAAFNHPIGGAPVEIRTEYPVWARI